MFVASGSRRSGFGFNAVGLVKPQVFERDNAGCCLNDVGDCVCDVDETPDEHRLLFDDIEILS